MKIKTLPLAALVIGLATVIGTPSPARAASDAAFLKKAAQGNRAEVELGRITQQKAVSARVRAFGQKMIDDHTVGLGRVETVARRESVSLPAGVGPENSALARKLSRLSGSAYDRAYTRAMVQDHKKVIKMFEQEARHGQDPEVRALARQMLPTLQMHLRMAQEISNSLPKAAAAH